ncbi:unnamed protein product, partial [Candidula unifasciata]
MSPTVNSQVYETNNPSMFNPPSIRRTSSQNTKQTDAKDKGFSQGDAKDKRFPQADAKDKGFPQADAKDKGFPQADAKGKGFPQADAKCKGLPQGGTKDNSPPNERARFNSAARDVGCMEPGARGMPDKKFNQELSKSSPDTLTRGKATDFTVKPGLPSGAVSVFPASASLPNASSNFGAKGKVSFQNINLTNKESIKQPGIKNNEKNMTGTLSITQADSYIGVNCGSKYRDGEKFSISEPCLYSHRMFIRAAKIFEFLKQDDVDGEEDDVGGENGGSENAQKGELPELDFENPQEQMKTFELTFATLKYQKLFRGILEHSGFFTDYPCFSGDRSLVCIILFDLQTRKFQKYKPHEHEQVDELCCDIEAALLSKKTRLLSHVAKERIKHNAPSIEHLLPEQVRNKDETKTSTPVFLWVNEMKTTMDDMISALEAENFQRLSPEEDISQQTDNVFQVDTHCSDLLIFPPHLDMYVKDTAWVKSGQLVQQDKSSCLAPQSVKHLLGIDQDVIHVNVGTGITTAHLASLLRKTSPNSHIWGFGLDSPDKIRKAAKNLEFLGAKNIKLLTDNFLNVETDEPKLKNVRVIMISANCSKSAITSPVQFIVSEGEDMRFLGELSKADQGLSGLSNLVQEHEKLLRHALK